MFHKRHMSYQQQLQHTIAVNLDENDSDEEDFYGHREPTWKDDLRFYYQNFKQKIQAHSRRTLIARVSIIAVAVLTVLGFRFQGEAGHSRRPIEIDESFTVNYNDTSPLHKVVLPSYNSLYPEAKQVPKSVDMFDFRLGSSLLLLYLQYYLDSVTGPLPMDLSIPFSWHDWIDFSERLRFDDDQLIDWLHYHSTGFSKDIGTLKRLDCNSFCLLYGCEGSIKFQNACKDISPTKAYPYSFLLEEPVDTRIREAGRALISGGHLFHKMPNPKRLFLLGIEDTNVVLKVDSNPHRTKKFLRSPEMMKLLLEWQSQKSKTDIRDNWTKGLEIRHLRQKTASFLAARGAKLTLRSPNQKLRRDRTRVIKLESVKKGMKMDHWHSGDFVWNENEFLEKMNRLSLDASNELDLELYKNTLDVEQYRLNNGHHPKYLQEAYLYETTLGSHYDWRFFSTSLILNNYRQSIIHRLARTWLRFCFQNGLKTYIAYGSMLGWIRNGLTLPWDSDIDAVVTMQSLHTLARDFNQTLIIDYTEKDGMQSGMTGYFIDINPTYYSRIKGDGYNAIDGRLIDISTGIYLDITALAWTENYLVQAELNEKFRKLVDPNYNVNRIFALEGAEQYENSIEKELNSLQMERKLVHCKNDNVFNLEELQDMIPSHFEGVRAWFPSKYDEIIKRLYTKAHQDFFEEYNYKSYVRLWAPQAECPRNDDNDGELCESSEIQQEFRLTKDYTQRHINMIERQEWSSLTLHHDSESKPLRIDDFFLDYGHSLGLSKEEIENIYLA